jgi:hypothetical protein
MTARAHLPPPPVLETPLEMPKQLLVRLAVMASAVGAVHLGPSFAEALARGNVPLANVPVMSLVSSVWAVMEHVYGPTTPDSSPSDYDPTEPQVYLRLTPEQLPETDVVATTRYPEE